jgi:hypothetical protein
LLLGRPGEEGLIPSQWIGNWVGGNSLASNLFASVVGAFMYFATLTEVPILQGLIGNGMGEGPALALLLAGPAISLPNMLVIRSVMGTRKTIVFVTLVIVMATVSGMIYGEFFGGEKDERSQSAGPWVSEMSGTDGADSESGQGARYGVFGRKSDGYPTDHKLRCHDDASLSCRWSGESDRQSTVTG